MKLFDEFEAVKFPEENRIFITKSEFLFYIGDPECGRWQKHIDAGNVLITVSNYPDVSREELMDAMRGVFPQKETDFLRLCDASEWNVGDMLELLKEDYAACLSDSSIYNTVYRFLRESNIRHKSYEKLRKLLDDAVMQQMERGQVLAQIHALSLAVIGRDLFRREIQIVDGHDSSSYFWIMPVRVVDDSDTNDGNHVAEMGNAEISIEETDVERYLAPFLYKHFDKELEANRKRVELYWDADEGEGQNVFYQGFEWNLTYNYYTFTSVAKMLRDIRDTVDALSSGRENDYTGHINKAIEQSVQIRMRAGQAAEIHDELELVTNFYRRFLYRMEYMIQVGGENGYNLISFMGP